MTKLVRCPSIAVSCRNKKNQVLQYVRNSKSEDFWGPASVGKVASLNGKDGPPGTKHVFQDLNHGKKHPGLPSNQNPIEEHKGVQDLIEEL